MFNKPREKKEQSYIIESGDFKNHQADIWLYISGAKVYYNVDITLLCPFIFCFNT